MENYRLHSVELGPSGSLPILIAWKGSDVDGVAVHEESFEEAKALGGVRQIDGRALGLFVNDSEKFDKKYGRLTAEDRRQILGILILIGAIRKKDPATLESAIKKLTAPPFEDMERDLLEKQPGFELATRLARGIRGVEFILWSKDDGRDLSHLPGLRCPDIRTALYVLAVMETEGGKGLGACVVCGQPFTRQRSTRKTCSGKCRYALFAQRKAAKAQRRKRT